MPRDEWYTNGQPFPYQGDPYWTEDVRDTQGIEAKRRMTVPKTPILESELTDDKLCAKGKWPVAELLVDHVQGTCTPVPKGTRGIITSVPLDGRPHVFLFPHTVLREHKAFRDGDLRVVPKESYRIIGRIDHA